MTMAVFGIRSAWFAVRKVVNLVKTYDSQVSADFEYMGYCIANVVAPAVQKLVNLVYKLLSYINAISVAWFGVNLFANSSVSAFKKMQDSANKINKSMQGFDEANVMPDESSSSDSSSSTPSTDLSELQADVPAWLQWIIDNKDLLLSVVAGVAAGIIAIKLRTWWVKGFGYWRISYSG